MPPATWLLAVFGLLLGSGCQRRIDDDAPTVEAEQFAAATCAASTTCGCAPRLDSEEECVRVLAERFTSVQSELELDEDCFEEFLADPGLGACAAIDEIAARLPCAALRGRTKEGEPCSPHHELPTLFTLINECEEGLVCSQGVCMETLMAVGGQASDRCNPSAPNSCDGFSGFFCGSDGLCHAAAGVGEPCASPFDCSQGFASESGIIAYCRLGGEDVGTCVARGEVGDPCDPLEYQPCFDSRPDSDLVWCDPSTRTCAEGRGPAVCQAMHHPFVGPG